MVAPPIKFTEPPDNTLAQCDSTLGAYLRAWDQVEAHLLPLFNALLGTHQNATLVLLSAGIDQPTLRNILDALASFRLKKAQQERLSAILRRWKAASTKRNRIVHGHWLLWIKMVEGPSGKRDHTKSTWIRFYNPADPKVLERLITGKDQKLTAAHQFRLKDIEQAAADVRRLAKDIEAFNGSVTVLPFMTPQHIDIDQSAIQTPPAAGGG